MGRTSFYASETVNPDGITLNSHQVLGN